MTKPTVNVEPKAPLPPACEQLAQLLAVIDARIHTREAEAERAGMVADVKAQVKRRKPGKRKAA